MSIATELSTLTTNIGNAYDAVSAKSGTLPANKNTNNLATAISSIPSGGGGNIVNGVIKNYKANSSTISANTFVEFINNITTGTDTQLSSDTFSYNTLSAVALDSTRVFVAHAANSARLHGVVCTISGSTITVGTAVQLSSDGNSSQYNSSVLIDTDKVFVSHCYDGRNQYLYGVVCTINGDVITAGTDTQITTSTRSCQYNSPISIDTNKVFIAHPVNNRSFYGVVCTIEGTTITVGTDTQLTTVDSSYLYASTLLLATNKVFIAHPSNGYLTGMICTINGTNITVETDTRLSTIYYIYAETSMVQLGNNKIFIAYGYPNDFSICGLICTVSGNNITTTTSTVLTQRQNPNDYMSAALADNNKILVTFNRASHLYGVTCFVEGDTILAGSAIELSTLTNSYYYSSPVSLGANKIFVAHRGGSYAYGIVCEPTDLTVTSSTSEINGLTKTECTTSTAGEVWVLNS